MKERIIGTIFLIAWLLCGCSIDQVCDDPKAAGIFAIALIVIILCAKVMGGRHD